MDGCVASEGINWSGWSHLCGEGDSQFVSPSGRVDWEYTFVDPDWDFGRFLPVAPPEGWRRGSDDPGGVSGWRRPHPSQWAVRSGEIVSVGGLKEIWP